MNSKFSLQKEDGFSLFEVAHEQGLKYLNQLNYVDTILPIPDRDYVCDYFSAWQEAAKQKNKPVDTMFKFLFKRRNALHEPSDDLKYLETNGFAFNMIFYQIMFDVRFGKLPGISISFTQFIDEVSDEDAVTLTALNLQVKHGDDTKSLTK